MMIPMIEVRKNKIVKDQMTLMIVEKSQGLDVIRGIVNIRMIMSISRKKRGKEKAEEARRGKVVRRDSRNTHISKKSKKKTIPENILLMMKMIEKTLITVDMEEELKI